jgi:hypothetical protein
MTDQDDTEDTGDGTAEDDSRVIPDGEHHDQVVWPGDPADEQRDLHDADALLEDPDHPAVQALRAKATRPRSVRKIKGGVTVYDFRGTGLCPPNGGRITPVAFVQHIPVVRNVTGIADFITLGNVLRAQGLAVQRATDAEGGVALYTSLHQLCYHARGVNAISVGSENMHYSTGEDWTEQQFRAVAWCLAQARSEVGIPYRGAHLVPGSGVAGVARTGHTTHQRVSDAAGFHDRTDPGPRYRPGHVNELARFFDKHGRF